MRRLIKNKDQKSDISTHFDQQLKEFVGILCANENITFYICDNKLEIMSQGKIIISLSNVNKQIFQLLLLHLKAAYLQKKQQNTYYLFLALSFSFHPHMIAQ